ncbi:hypothetical protein MMC13_003147 [Lambiella insularis]|nr:hypothetical protein [Lambiella insularis]
MEVTGNSLKMKIFSITALQVFDTWRQTNQRVMIPLSPTKLRSIMVNTSMGRASQFIGAMVLIRRLSDAEIDAWRLKADDEQEKKEVKLDLEVSVNTQRITFAAASTTIRMTQ